jgi:Lsr2
MAKRVIIWLEDDLDGSEASESITFSLDGVEYEIDLNDAHANELREALSKYTAAARKSGGRPRPARLSSSGVDSKAIRAWAMANGIPMNTRGRIQADVIDKYTAAH